MCGLYAGRARGTYIQSYREAYDVQGVGHDAVGADTGRLVESSDM
jgi:hypothetical protein